ncbi:MAG: hypothetical protein BMS9Abin36_0010 [Gammaproteobacteria bacterium]|nr:MAG: hypothetical protein BMS9Abin36_0010 [Gammaproteobacteria bacterium]
MQHNMHKVTGENYITMHILHILNDGPTELSDQVIDMHSRECQIEVVDLKKGDFSYEDLVEKIFSCDRVISW